jgi:hypothetical protein
MILQEDERKNKEKDHLYKNSGVFTEKGWFQPQNHPFLY